jgi:hypothetical protein
MFVETPLVFGESRDTIVAQQGIGERKNLPVIGWVCEGFGIANHSRVEDHFTTG